MPERADCNSYGAGHQVHWIAANRARTEPGVEGRLGLDGEVVVFTDSIGDRRLVFVHRAGAHALRQAGADGVEARLVPGVHLLSIPAPDGCRWFNISDTPVDCCT